MLAVALITAPTPGNSAPASDAALQQRIELLERHTAAAKGEMATLQAAWHRLDTRPSLDACRSFADAATRSLTDLEVLAVEYTTLGSLATANPERASAAAVGAVELRRARDELLAHALTVTRTCERLPPETVDAAAAPAAGRPRDGRLRLRARRDLLWGPDAVGYAQPGGGLRAGRLLAGSRHDARVGPGQAPRTGLRGGGLRREFPLGQAAPGAAAAGLVHLDARGYPLRVVVLPGHGSLAETPVLYGIARSFADGRVQ